MILISFLHILYMTISIKDERNSHLLSSSEILQDCIIKIIYDHREILKSKVFLLGQFCPSHSIAHECSTDCLWVPRFLQPQDLCKFYFPARNALLPSLHLAGTHSPITFQLTHHLISKTFTDCPFPNLNPLSSTTSFFLYSMALT